MQRYRIAGYLNPIMCDGVPLITLARRNTKLIAIYPSGMVVDIVENGQQPTDMESFIPCQRSRKIRAGEISYLCAMGNVHTGRVEQLLRIMREDLSILDDADHRDMLEELIVKEEEKIIASSLNRHLSSEMVVCTTPVDQLAIAQSSYALVLFTSLRTKPDGTRAPRLHIQSCRFGQWRTHYSKNMSTLYLVKEMRERHLFERVANCLTHMGVRNGPEKVKRAELELESLV